jgi:hypothetical protein
MLLHLMPAANCFYQPVSQPGIRSIRFPTSAPRNTSPEAKESAQAQPGFIPNQTILSTDIGPIGTGPPQNY